MEPYRLNYSNPNSPRWGDTSQNSVIVRVTFEGRTEEVDFLCSPDEEVQLHSIELRTNALNGDYGTIQPYQSPADITGQECQDILVDVVDVMKSEETDADYIASLENLKTSSPSASMVWSEENGGYEWNNVTWPEKG